MSTTASWSHEQFDLIIIGAGPVGLYATYYAGFRGMKVAVVDTLPELGGQVTAMYPEKLIFDVAGFPAITGRELVSNLVSQAQSANASYFLSESAVELQQIDAGFILSTDNRRLEAKAILITAGIGAFKPRQTPVGAEFLGRGLSYFVPNLQVYQDKKVVILGGGDSALDWAWTLAPIAASVDLVHRRREFRGHEGSLRRAQESSTSFHTPYDISAAYGAEHIEAIDICHRETGEVHRLPCDEVVAAFGFTANIGPLANWGLQLEKRRIVVDQSMATTIPGVFAAGDITTYPGKVGSTPLVSVRPPQR